MKNRLREAKEVAAVLINPLPVWEAGGQGRADLSL